MPETTLSPERGRHPDRLNADQLQAITDYLKLHESLMTERRVNERRGAFRLRRVQGMSYDLVDTSRGVKVVREQLTSTGLVRRQPRQIDTLAINEGVRRDSMPRWKADIDLTTGEFDLKLGIHRHASSDESSKDELLALVLHAFPIEGQDQAHYDAIPSLLVEAAVRVERNNHPDADDEADAVGK